MKLTQENQYLEIETSQNDKISFDECTGSTAFGLSLCLSAKTQIKDSAPKDFNFDDDQDILADYFFSFSDTFHYEVN